MTRHYQQSLSTYANQQIETASPEQLLLMLYDGAIRFLNEAKHAHSENNLEVFNSKLIRTQNILSELMSSLDMKIGGDLAQNLFRLYEYLHYTLIQANVKKDTMMLDEVQTHLKELRETWQTAIETAKREERATRQRTTSTEVLPLSDSEPERRMPETDSLARSFSA